MECTSQKVAAFIVYSKDSKQLPDYLRAVSKYLGEHQIYKCIAKLTKSKRSYHKGVEEIDQEIIQATKYGEQQCEKRHKDFLGF